VSYSRWISGKAKQLAKNVARYPLDVVKTRIQLQHGKAISSSEGYTGVIDCFRKIVRNEGVSRLYRGITAPILMEVPKR
jgi:solute carrier family 25 2-oxodicarboxylate transporter 21